MSYSPPLLANRRWSVAGTTTEDEFYGAPVSAIRTGASVHRNSSSNAGLTPAIPAGIQPGDTMILMVSGSNIIDNALPGWTFVAGSSPNNGPGAGLVSYYKSYVPGDVVPTITKAAVQALTARVISITGRWLPTVNQSQANVSGTSGSAYSTKAGSLNIWALSIGASEASASATGPTWTVLGFDNADFTTWIAAAQTSAQLTTQPSWPTAAVSAQSLMTFAPAPITSVWNQFAVPSWVELSPSAPFDTFTLDAVIDPPPTTSATSNYKWLLEIATGAAGAEVPIIPFIEFSSPLGSGASAGLWSPQLSIPLAIKAGQRVSARGLMPSAISITPGVRLAFGGV